MCTCSTLLLWSVPVYAKYFTILEKITSAVLIEWFAFQTPTLIIFEIIQRYLY
jgi:hypothetical protein